MTTLCSLYLNLKAKNGKSVKAVGLAKRSHTAKCNGNKYELKE